MMASFKIICLFLLFAAVSAQLGGSKPVDLTDANTQKAESIAKDEAVKKSGVCADGVTFKEAKRQTVNGVIYTFTYEADPTRCGATGNKKTCTIKVFSTVSQEMSIQNSSCE